MDLAAPEFPELSAGRVTNVLELCRTWADHTVVDTGFNPEADEEIVSDLFAPRRNAATVAALRAADTVVAVGAGDPIGQARYSDRAAFKVGDHDHLALPEHPPACSVDAKE